jgi:hypothetical protein
MDYHTDIYGSMCLELSTNSKSSLGFGAILVSKNGAIIGKGWNRRSTKEEREIMHYVDYGIHAEQAAIVDAILSNLYVLGAQIYVLGQVLTGPNKNLLTIKDEKVFICTKCPHAFIQYNISVNIPHKDGWLNMNPEEATESGKKFYGQHYWYKFAVALK